VGRQKVNWSANDKILIDARADLYDILTELGVQETGDVSFVTTSGAANSLVRTGASGELVLLGASVSRYAGNAGQVFLSRQSDGLKNIGIRCKAAENTLDFVNQSGGGSFTWGDGTTDIMSLNGLNGNLGINGGLTAGGDSLIKVTSSSAFKVQNGAGIDILKVDTTNELIKFNRKTASSDLTELTIFAGSIDITGDWHVIDTQDNLATDELDTINGGVNGQTLYLTQVSPSRVTTFKSGTGNMILSGGSDYTPSVEKEILTLKFTGSNWYEVSRGV